MKIEAIWSTKLTGYSTDTAESCALRVERLNLFIGPNNSGKSRLLRSLLSSKRGEIQIGFGESLKTVLSELGPILNIFQNNPRVHNFNSEVFLDLIHGECLSLDALKASFGEFSKVINEASSSHFNLMGGGEEIRAFNNLKDMLFDEQNQEIARRVAGEFGGRINDVLTFKSHYIPILRGMRPLDDEKDAFLDRTLKDYFPIKDTRAGFDIVTGFNLYQLLVRFLLGQPDDRHRIREYEKILGHEFFGGAEITLIPEYGKDTVSVKIGDDDQFSIYDLGDGMQQVIIITSAAFLEQENSIFYIEEPEACLHPGLLRKLALFLLNHTTHQYFATTHSNHLLDLAEVDKRVTIHKVSKVMARSDAQFVVRECTRDRELLAELGVLASSVYLANSTIWVEGITDRLYLGAFLKRYVATLADPQQKITLEGLLENYHYSFVEYQGGTLGHWSFDESEDSEGLNASRLCSSAFLLADGDIVGKGERASVLGSELGMRLHILPCKEIENLLPRSIIVKTAKDIFSRKKGKTTDGLSSDQLDKLTYDVEGSRYGIGYLLDRALGLPGKGKDARKVFADASGTIEGKVKFCLAAIDAMNASEWELSSSVRELCQKIFDHILERNWG
jgi:hypothetical protein